MMLVAKKASMMFDLSTYLDPEVSRRLEKLIFEYVCGSIRREG